MYPSIPEARHLSRSPIIATGIHPSAIPKVGAVQASERRVHSIIGRPAPPEAADAELLVLLAAARALALPDAIWHAKAHARIASIGQGAAIPAAVTALAEELGTTTMKDLQIACCRPPEETFTTRTSPAGPTSPLLSPTGRGPGAKHTRR
jgi:hypothetical protein